MLLLQIHLSCLLHQGNKPVQIFINYSLTKYSQLLFSYILTSLMFGEYSLIFMNFSDRLVRVWKPTDVLDEQLKGIYHV